MGFYNVATSYEYTTVMVGVEAEDEETAISNALEVMKAEWGAGVLDFYQAEAELIF